MNLNEILNSLTDGDVTVEKAKELLSLHAIEKIENVAQIDLGRKIRKGIPEVIFAESKQVSDIQKIIELELDDDEKGWIDKGVKSIKDGLSGIDF